ncbi:MAG: 2,3-diphosphoglycerate-dependent phosphoglycerate mutase [Ferroplasma sp.]
MDSYIFVRHGESTTNVQNILSDDVDKNPLTDRGRKQVERTAKQLKGLKFDGIISSPVKRAYETAEIISEYTGTDISIDERLREVALGEAYGHNINEFLDELYPNSHITGKIREGLKMEEWGSLTERVLSCMDDYNGNYIFTTHSDPIRAIVSHFLHFSESNSYGISIRNASMTVISGKQHSILCIGAINLDDEIKKLFL